MAQHVDTHAHLCHRAYRDDMEAVMQRAAERGLETVVNVGFDLPSSRIAIEAAERWPQCVCSVGIHPHEASRLTDRALRDLRMLASRPGVVAIGETGLDFYRMLSPRWSQEDAFRKSLRLAIQQGLPLIVHCREAEEGVLHTLEEFKAALRDRAVLHCFSSLPEYARRYVGEGYYVGFAGNITYWDEVRLRRVVQQVPPDRMLAETDSPYLAPHPHRGDRNEPANLPLVVKSLAHALGMPEDELGAQLRRNAQRFYNLPNTGG